MTTAESSRQRAQLLDYLSVGLRTSAEIQARFGWSQPTVSRLLARCTGEVFVLGSTHNRRYGRLRDVRGHGSSFPVYRIDEDGNAHPIGALSAVAHEGYVWARSEGAAETYRGLPWFISDLRPEGFVGRAFVRELHQDLGLPAREKDWHDDHVLLALARRGEDCMGNLIVGQESLSRFFEKVPWPTVPLLPEDIEQAYPSMAQAAMDGQPAGSSAGGEQPKFTAIIDQGAGVYDNVLVKFSHSVDSPAGRRWADLLICEHHALEVVSEKGIPAARSRIVEAGDQVFLEVLRFDRVGRFGRQPILSLRAVDNEFYGEMDSWTGAATRMLADRRITPADAASLRWLSVFGDLIANTDQHFGNISLIMVDGRRLYSLAPAYDMLPMLYRPREAEVTYPVFNPPPAAPHAPGEWGSALHWAAVFWERVSVDPRISEEFREICRANLDRVLRLAAGPRLVA